MNLLLQHATRHLLHLEEKLTHALITDKHEFVLLFIDLEVELLAESGSPANSTTQRMKNLADLYNKVHIDLDRRRINNY